jgi:hypothetical protein
MKRAEITIREPGDDEAATPVRRFVVIVGEPADGGSALTDVMRREGRT